MRVSTSQYKSGKRPEASLLNIGQLGLLVLLLILPAIAIFQQAEHLNHNWLFLLFSPLGTSIVSYILCFLDKGRAKSGAWRISESTLHLFEFVGGWPGSFIAQRQFRHKTNKGSYQFTFWFIVFIYQVVALDSFRDWAWARFISKLIQSLLQT